MLSSKRQLTDVTKFILALLVVNGHLFMFYSGMPDVARWMNLGAQCVSLFLFFSAYGVMCAYERKGKSYLKGFLSRRIGRVLLPLVTAYAVSLPIYAIFNGPIDWINVLKTVGWGGPYLKFSWYVTEIVVLYVLFYCSARISSSVRMLAWVLSAAVLVLMAVLFVCKQPVWYINGLSCFILGLWFHEYESTIVSFLNKAKWPVLAILTICFFAEFQWHYVKDVLPSLSAWRYEYIAMYLSNVLFVLLVVTVLEMLPCNIKFNSWGGSLFAASMRFI